ncbi:PRTase-like protein [Acephala macrosclerotiorum]|nr:PRTase-like protein [Acephala macrosclerotiorum]
MSSTTLSPYKIGFLEAAINGGVLKFGSFELKSKRISPYFFNAGDFYRAGVPLATSTVGKLAGLEPEKYRSVCYSFDREEAKDHGEGKRVLIVDDVVTAGTAKREAIGKIRQEGGIIVGILVTLDRIEKLPAPNGDDPKTPMPSAIEEIRKEYGIPVFSILTLNDIIGGLKGKIADEDIKRMDEYRVKYAASD